MSSYLTPRPDYVAATLDRKDKEIAKLTADNARLQKALIEIIETIWGHADCLRIASDALQKHEE